MRLRGALRLARFVLPGVACIRGYADDGRNQDDDHDDEGPLGPLRFGEYGAAAFVGRAAVPVARAARAVVRRHPLAKAGAAAVFVFFAVKRYGAAALRVAPVGALRAVARRVAGLLSTYAAVAALSLVVVAHGAHGPLCCICRFCVGCVRVQVTTGQMGETRQFSGVYQREIQRWAALYTRGAQHLDCASGKTRKGMPISRVCGPP